MEHRPLFHVKHLRGMECGQKTVMAAVIVSGARGTCDVPHPLKQLAVPGSRWRVRRSTSSPGRDAIAGWADQCRRRGCRVASAGFSAPYEEAECR